MYMVWHATHVSAVLPLMPAFMIMCCHVLHGNMVCVCTLPSSDNALKLCFAVLCRVLQAW